MQTARIDEMTRGWFVGNFSPTLYSTNDVEVAMKNYTAGEKEAWHYHKIATEITVVVSGEVEFDGSRFVAGDIVKLAPGEGTEFRALTDAVTVVVKLPGANNDKYSREGKPC